MSPFKARTRIAILIMVTVLSVLGASLAFASTAVPGRVAPAQTSGTFCVTDDSFVEQHNPDDNLGGSLRMEADTIRGDGRLERIISYIKFDLSSLPSGTTLTNATLRVTVRSSGTGGTLHNVNVYTTSSNWSQGTITWNNQPGLGGLVGTLPAPLSPGQAVSVGLATGFFSVPGAYSFALAFPEEDRHSDGIDFVTLEDPTSDAIACLDVTYTTNGAPNQPPTIAAVPNQTLTVGQVVDLRLTVTDENVAGLQFVGSSGNGAVLSAAVVLPGPYLRLTAIAPGTTTATVSVSDGVNLPVSTTLNVTVNAAPPPPPPPPPQQPTVAPPPTIVPPPPPQQPTVVPPTTVPPTAVPPTAVPPTLIPPPQLPTATPDPDVPVYSEADHRRAQAPLCADLAGQTNPAVRAGVPDGAVPGGSINCRVLAIDGVFPNPIDSARVGDPGLITYGIISAVDVFGVNSNGFADPTFEHAVTVCLLGEGRLIYLSALNSPRTTYEPPAFVEGDYTCTSIPAAGTVVLIPPQPMN